ncbi:MAG: rhomboid family intramembrane serine protease, partial [Erysipelotrichaceae bacterium]|nr:rhomboid family intramembrane serine protease [Erysipelotrichaceae bacterium]
MLSSFVYYRKDEIPLTFVLMAIIYLGGQVVEGLFNYDTISQFGHLIGGITGSAFGFYLNANR